MDSFISWVGGKKALRKLIYTMFPVNFDRYIEVFGGGGWVLFGKPPDCRCMEVYNDYNSNLANLFSCVKDRTWAFLKELGFLPINSRDEFSVIRRFLDKQEFDGRFLAEELELAQVSLPVPDFEEIRSILMENAEVTDVKRAAAFFKLIRYSYGSGCTSYGCKNFDVRKCFDTIWQASRRLADTVVENKDFEALIRQYDRDSAFFYCDPPYYETEGHYAVVFRKEDHARLRDVLAGCKGKWMVSYNDCDFIRDLYAGYTITAVTRINNLAQRYDGGCEFPEVLITNYDPKERERAQPVQMSLFGLCGGSDAEGGYGIMETAQEKEGGTYGQCDL
ncbi:MAG: DNA adenine methylase [Acetatifactor sp.]|nr:DNA adenine methylase [Acetatifactor sp.]